MKSLTGSEIPEAEIGATSALSFVCDDLAFLDSYSTMQGSKLIFLFQNKKNKNACVVDKIDFRFFAQHTPRRLLTTTRPQSPVDRPYGALLGSKLNVLTFCSMSI